MHGEEFVEDCDKYGLYTLNITSQRRQGHDLQN